MEGTVLGCRGEAVGGDGLRIRVQGIAASRVWQPFPIPVGPPPPPPSIRPCGWCAPLGALVGRSVPEPGVQMSKGHHRPPPHRAPNPASRSPGGAWPPPHGSRTLAWAGHEQVLCWGGGRKGYRPRPEAPAASRRGQQGRVDWQQAALRLLPSRSAGLQIAIRKALGFPSRGKATNVLLGA